MNVSQKRKEGCSKGCPWYSPGNPKVFPLGWCCGNQGQPIHKLKTCPKRQPQNREQGGRSP